MLTEAQETAYIHELLPRLRDLPPGAIALTEDLAEVGYPRAATMIVMERLETEGLVKRGYGMTLNLTTIGMQVARDPCGYTAHLRRQRRQANIKNIREALGAYGSIIGGVAGAAGVIIACLSLNDARHTTSEMDGLRTHVNELEKQRIPAVETRLTNLEKLPALVTQPPAAPALPLQKGHAQKRRHKH